MDLVRCDNGHFFDKERYGECPFCLESNEADVLKKVKRFEPLESKWYFDSLIGVGASAKVYKLTNKENSETTAVKLIEITKKNINYLNRKNEIINKLALQYSLNDCPNIVKILSHYVFDDSEMNILVQMEFLNPIANYLKNASITENDVWDLAIDICHALEYCERKNIVHRDIKPENIFIDKSGNYKLGDFGISENINEIKTRSLKGTLSFVAPEVMNEGEYSFQSDIYSLGIVLYKLMNDNMFPFQKQHDMDINERRELIERRMIGEAFAPPKNASSKFSKVIMKACAFDKKLRYKDAKEMLKDLLLITDCSNQYLNFSDINQEASTILFDDTYYLQAEKTVDCFQGVARNEMITPRMNLKISENFNTEQKNKLSQEDSDITQKHKIKITRKNSQDKKDSNLSSRLCYRMINWICFTCIMSLMPMIIFFICRTLFLPMFPHINRSISEFVLFSLGLSVITIREIFANRLWRKEQSICGLTLFINIIILILSTVIIGILTMSEMNLLKSTTDNYELYIFSIVLSIISFLSGTAIQVWEEL